MEASRSDQRPGSAITPVPTRLLAVQPDAVLCRLAARGNAAAFAALYERHRLPLVAFVYHLLARSGSAEDAEDVTQDAFARAFTAIREKRVDGSFKSWLYTIARNRAIDLMRARRESVSSLEDRIGQPQGAPEAEQTESRAEQRAELEWLLTAVAGLPERQREALLLKEMGGLSHQLIAEQLGTTVSATKKLISRGREGLQDAALAGGHRVDRRLGHDLAIAAPVVPFSVSLATLGVGVGSAAGGGALGGSVAAKLAATVLAVAAAGGGVAAVEHRRMGDHQRAAAAVVSDAVTVPGGSGSADQFLGMPVATSSATRSDRGDEETDDDADERERDDDSDRGDRDDDDRGERSDDVEDDESDDDDVDDDVPARNRHRGRSREDRDDDDAPPGGTRSQPTSDHDDDAADSDDQDD